jgi:hypothetical protein
MDQNGSSVGRRMRAIESIGGYQSVGCMWIRFDLIAGTYQDSSSPTSGLVTDLTLKGLSQDSILKRPDWQQPEPVGSQSA